VIIDTTGRSIFALVAICLSFLFVCCYFNPVAGIIDESEPGASAPEE
jgi:hypothetical protein